MVKLSETAIIQLDELIKEIIAKNNISGMAVAVIDKETTIYKSFSGYRDVENKQRINQDTIFGLASITKSFTCLSIMQMASKGLIDIYAPVSEYLPNYDARDQKVLVWHLMSHCAGYYPMERILVQQVAETLEIWQDGKAELTCNTQLAQHAGRLVADRMNSRTDFIGRPAEYMSYSNDGYALLSEIIRIHGGCGSYTEYVTENILKPLGMERSGCDFIAPLNDENTAVLYKNENDKLKSGFDFYDNAFALNGGGAMKSTMADMERYLRMLMTGGEGIIDNYSLREMLKPRQEYAFQQYYGYGISSRQIGALNIYGHGGSLTGVSTNMAWSPQAQVGVIVLCNTSGAPVATVSNAVFRLMEGMTPLPSAERDQPRLMSLSTKQSACGTYTSGEGTTFDITLNEEDALELSRQGKPIGYATHSFNRLSLDGWPSRGELLFMTDEEGQVWGLRTGGRIIKKDCN